MKRKTKSESQPASDLPLDIVPRAQLTLCNETIYLTRFDRGIPSATYPVEMRHVAVAFGDLRGATTGLLPDGALFFTENKGRSRIGVWLRPAVRSITLAAGRRPQVLRVPLPGCVFVGEGARYDVYTVVDRPTAESSPLYKMPLPNVHDDGHICAGNVKFPLCSAATISQAAALFFKSEFNYDLAAGKITADREPRSPRRSNLPFYDGEPETVGGEDDEEEYEDEESGAEGAELIALLRSLDGKRAFPARRMMRSSDPATLGDLMNVRKGDDDLISS